MTPSTCWNTPWTPQKQPPARIATSDVACRSAGSSSAGGGIERAPSAADGRMRSARPAPTASAAKIDTGRKKGEPRGNCGLLEAGLDETEDRMRHVRLLQRSNLVGGEFHVHRCESVVEMVQFGGADDRGGNDRLGQQPCQRHLRP